MTESVLTKLNFSEDDVLEALSQMKPNKCDSSGVFSEHLKHASPVIAEPLALFLSSVVCHGYMPKGFRDCTLIPIPKSNKDPSCCQNYCPIRLSSNLFERIILLKFADLFTTSQLQFGFKPGYSTTLCTGMVKNVVSRYIKPLFSFGFLLQVITIILNPLP